ncbi:MAG: hypothetical protein IJK81_13400 [Selenomonadaceae bacterium]|nr:hypothetical protein [Selenomonadaceae bacterium]
MGIPQILMIVIFSLHMLMSILTHGKETEVRRRNAVTDFFSVAIFVAILYAGGFWSQ